MVKRLREQVKRLREALQWAVKEAKGRLPDWFTEVLAATAPTEPAK